MMLYRKLTIVSCIMFTSGIASIHLVNVSIVTNKNLNPPGALGSIPMMWYDVDSPYCKGPEEINWPKRICMLCCLLLEELTVIALGDDLYHVILSCRPVETVSECLVDDRTP
jgi:hypothetical protein